MANPNDIRVLFEQALRKHQAGHFGGAEKLYRRILDQNPKHRDSLHLLGVIRLSEKKFKDAIVLIEKSLGLGSDVAAICFNLARAYEESGQLDQALSLFERAQRQDPRDAEIVFGIGTVLSAKQLHVEALAAFDRSLDIAPRQANAHNNKGIALKNLDRFDEALDSYSAAIAIDTKQTDALMNRAALLQLLYRLEEAEADYTQVLNQSPKNAEAWFQRGKAFATQKRHLEAIADFVEAASLQPDNIEYLAALLVERSKICDWIDFEKNHRKLYRGLEKQNRSVPPMTLTRLFDSPDFILQAAQQFSPTSLNFERQGIAIEPLDNRKIKIGYVSSDLHDRHPVYQALEGVLKHHDRTEFEVHHFLLPLPVKQPVPGALLALGDTVHELDHSRRSQILERIREVRLDVAIDLNGFTKFNKVETFRSGIAPVQINFLGSPGTMGRGAHDYIIGDATLMPPETFQQFSEQIVWMPNSFFPVNNNRPIAAVPPTRTAAGLPENGLVFGYFGMADRILPDVFSTWMNILKSVNHSVLWLKVANDLARENLLKQAAFHGVATERVIFANRTESNADHLARLALMDICLDTLPYNAHMTALDCLFAGVPVLSQKGKTFAARVASSLLHACGLTELICEDRKSYEEAARRLATTPQELANIKSKLKLAHSTKPLFDTAEYTRDLEKAYMIMVQRCADGLPPQHFAVK